MQRSILNFLINGKNRNKNELEKVKKLIKEKKKRSTVREIMQKESKYFFFYLSLFSFLLWLKTKNFFHKIRFISLAYTPSRMHIFPSPLFTHAIFAKTFKPDPSLVYSWIRLFPQSSLQIIIQRVSSNFSVQKIIHRG